MGFKFNFKLNGENIKKYMINCLIVCLIGILIILAANILSSNYRKNKNNDVDAEQTNSKNVELNLSTSYEDKIKRELIDILSQIKGVGRVNVMVYFEGSTESQPAYNINENNRTIQEKDSQGGTRTTNENNKSINVVMMNEGSSQKPFILKQVNPSIGGVIVVAEGADNPIVKETIKNAVKTVLNLPANKVTVEPMKK
ncbi:MAG: spoIIIAG [Caloramator sp.]|jgi:stage III sporulation protein AG|uniref:stage III sporulation protein AG n=1 Tax=Caloramator sp. TaxID=1871330 RepID=UPI001DA4612E|nr:stage III sporulation protein AG [Caloramator sp.]MBZ4662409.1 spoIIIAG [Caloramator sp.]